MKEEEINIAIAEALGIVPCSEWEPFNSWSMIKTDCGHKDCYSTSLGPPKYTENLNACHEMEKVLKMDDEKVEFVIQLEDILKVSLREDSFLDIFTLVNATAPQRCEAFLRTKLLWKD